MNNQAPPPIPARKRFVIVSYDITNDKNRLKVMKALQDYGARVQYSVFECILRPKEISALMNRLRPHVQKMDSVRFYFLNAADVPRIEILGSGETLSDPITYLY